MKIEKANLEGWYLEDYHVESGWGMYWKWHKGVQSSGISELNQSPDYVLLKWSIIIIVNIISIKGKLWYLWGDLVCKSGSKTNIQCACDKMSKTFALT